MKTKVIMMDDVQIYLNKAVGLSVDIKKLPDARLTKLPLYLKHAYNYSLLESQGHSFILAESEDPTSRMAGQLKKQSKAIFQYLGLPVVFVMYIQSAQLKRKMIQDRINFIVPGKQIYLPELLISLQEIIRQPQPLSELITPSAQLLLLFHLQVERLDQFSFKDIAEKLNYTPKTITKIASELKAKNLCKITGTKEKRLVFEIEREQLWEMSEPQMQSPIAKSYFTNKNKDIDLCKSGDSALSHYTFLSDTGKEDYAVYKAEFEELKEKGHWGYLDGTEGEIRIEVWKYNPRLLSRNGFIDPLSLYLCYRGDGNERVEAEIKELTDKMVW